MNTKIFITRKEVAALFEISVRQFTRWANSNTKTGKQIKRCRVEVSGCCVRYNRNLLCKLFHLPL